MMHTNSSDAVWAARWRWLPALVIPVVIAGAGLLCADALARQQPPDIRKTVHPAIVAVTNPMQPDSVPAITPVDSFVAIEDFATPSVTVFDQPYGIGNGNGVGNGNGNGGVGNGNGGVGNGNGVGNGKH